MGKRSLRLNHVNTSKTHVEPSPSSGRNWIAISLLFMLLLSLIVVVKQSRRLPLMPIPVTRSVHEELPYDSLSDVADNLLNPNKDLEDVVLLSNRNSRSGFEIEQSEAGNAIDEGKTVFNKIVRRPKKPYLYRIACGTINGFVIKECISASIFAWKFEGDMSPAAGITVIGNSTVQAFSDYPRKPCFPHCHQYRSGKRFGYSLPLEPGKYHAKFYLTEPSIGKDTDRVMNIYIQGKPAFLMLDLFERTGAVDKTIVTDYFEFEHLRGNLNIEFAGEGVHGEALCNSFEILPHDYTVESESRLRFSRPAPYHVFCSTSNQANVQVMNLNHKLSLHNLGKLPGTSFNLFLFKIAQNGKHIIKEASGRVSFEGNMEQEECHCPMFLTHFLRNYSCPFKFEAAIRKMFERQNTSKAVSVEDLEMVEQQLEGKAVHCSIVRNELFCKGSHQSSQDWSIFCSLLLSLLRKVSIDDVEFIWHSSPSPLVKIDQSPATVLGPTSNERFTDIPVPSSRLIVASFTGLGLKVLGQSPAWWKKKNKAYYGTFGDSFVSWSQALSMQEMKRNLAVFHVVKMAGNKREELRNLSNVPRQFTEASQHHLILIMDEPNEPLSSMDVLFSGSVLVQKFHANRELFFELLSPSLHFFELPVAFKGFSKEVRSKLRDRGKLKAMADNGISFVVNDLSPEALLCWMAFVLEGVRSTLGFHVKVRDGMAKINDVGGKCDCP